MERAKSIAEITWVYTQWRLKAKSHGKDGENLVVCLGKLWNLQHRRILRTDYANMSLIFSWGKGMDQETYWDPDYFIIWGPRFCIVTVVKTSWLEFRVTLLENRQFNKSKYVQIRVFNFDECILTPILSIYKMSMIILVDILHDIMLLNKVI